METILPYSYLKDKNGWIHLVKWFLDDHHIITKPYYSPEKVKYKTIISKSTLPCGSQLNLLSRYDYIISIDHIYEIIKPQVIGQNDNLPQVINEIVEYYKNNSANVLLFGSRLLKINEEISDWDLIIDIEDNPKRVTDILLTKNKELRYFNKYEIKKRIDCYSVPYPISNFSSLKFLFNKTCIYLKTLTVGEIGLFFVNSKYQYDYLYKDIYKIFDKNIPTTNISGVINKGAGESFSFPRIFSITDEFGINQKVVSLSWEIGGIEELHGKTISLDKTIKIRDNLYFMLDIIKNMKIAEV